MKLKGFLATLMATTMVLGGTIGVSADPITAPNESGAYTQKVTGNSTITVPTIKITVPTDLSLTVDPYNIDGEGQINSEDRFIKNDSNVKIAVGMGLYATKEADSKVTLATAPLKGTETTKSAFIYADVVSSADGSTAEHPDKYDAKSASQFPLAIGTDAKYTTKNNMITLDKGNSSPTYAAYKFAGTVATNNKEAWTDKDKLTVNVVFNFTPVLDQQ